MRRLQKQCASRLSPYVMQQNVSIRIRPNMILSETLIADSITVMNIFLYSFGYGCELLFLSPIVLVTVTNRFYVGYPIVSVAFMIIFLYQISDSIGYSYEHFLNRISDRSSYGYEHFLYRIGSDSFSHTVMNIFIKDFR